MPGPLDAYDILPTGPAKAAEQPVAWTSAFAANFRLTQDDVASVQEKRKFDGYRRIEDALVDMGVDRAELRHAPVASLFGTPGVESRTPNSDAIWGRMQALRDRDPTLFRDVPKTRAEFEKGLLRRNGGRDRDQATAARGGLTASLAGGVGGSFTDPFNVLTLPISGGGKTIVQVMAREALLNGMLEGLQQPELAEGRRAMGEDFTVGDAAANIGFAAAGGAVLGGGFRAVEVGAPKIAGAAGNAYDATVEAVFNALPERIRNRWASAMELPDSALPDLIAGVRGAERLTPEERAAAHVITRQAEIDATSPFAPGWRNDAAHGDRLASAMQAILSDAAQPSLDARLRSSAAPVTGGQVASDVVQFFRGRGYSEAQARGIAAGIHAEAASNHNARNPTSGAFGLGQWLGARKQELFRRFGPRPTREQQLQFLDWELRGGDAGGKSVLRQGDETSVLDAYIRDFMRPAAGAETNGDLARGMTALGREAGGGGGDIAAAGRRSVDGDVVDGAPPALAAELPIATKGPARMMAPADVLQWIARRGGLVDDEGHNLRGMFDGNPFVPGAGALVRDGGMSLDRAREGLHEAGYLGALDGETTIADLLDVLDRSNRGERIYSYFDEADAQARRARMAEPDAVEFQARLDGPLGERGIDFDDEDYARAFQLFDGDMEGGFDRAIDGVINEKMDDVLEDMLAENDPDVYSYFRRLEDEGYGARSGEDGPSAQSPDEYGFDGLDARESGADPRDGGGAGASSRAAESDLASRGSAPDSALPALLDDFDDPSGVDADIQIDSLEHDLRMAAELDPDAGFRVGEEGDERTAADILAELDQDEADIAAMKACAAPAKGVAE